MSEKITISVKLSRDLYADLALRVPEGERSAFIREAIIEKLQKMPNPNTMMKFDHRIKRIEEQLSFIKKSLVDLEILTYEKGKINLHTFCIDNLDHSILDYLLHYNGATTSELAETLGVNRWLVLNRLKKIKKRSRKELGKNALEYFAGIKAGKKKAWWLAEDLTDN